MKIPVRLLTIAAILMSAPVAAHHSFAMFDRAKQVTLKGVVKEFQWTNPHSWVELTVFNPKGVAENWSFEALSPNVLRRQGWSRATIKPADHITVVFNPARDGTRFGNLVSVVTADGKTVGAPAQ